MRKYNVLYLEGVGEKICIMTQTIVVVEKKTMSLVLSTV